MPEHVSAQAIANKCKAFVRKIREGDFSMASQDACAPPQASGVKKTLSSVFFTLLTMFPCTAGSRRENVRRQNETSIACFPVRVIRIIHTDHAGCCTGTFSGHRRHFRETCAEGLSRRREALTFCRICSFTRPAGSGTLYHSLQRSFLQRGDESDHQQKKEDRGQEHGSGNDIL